MHVLHCFGVFLRARWPPPPPNPPFLPHGAGPLGVVLDLAERGGWGVPASEASGGLPPLSRTLYTGGEKHFSGNRWDLYTEEEKNLWRKTNVAM